MQAIDYAAAKTIDEAVSLLQQRGDMARVLSGGTDVIVQAREGRRNLSLLVDVKDIPELMEISIDPSTGLRLGASVPCHRIYENAEIQRLYPALVDSASLIGGIQIQSRASLGGNLCNSSPAADSIPTLIVLGAICEIAGPSGRREVSVEQFCTAPGRNVLAPGEMLVALRFPPPAPHSGARFLRFIPRNEMDIAVVNAATSLTLNAEGNRIESARIAVGAVAPTPLLVEEAGAALTGAAPTEENIQKAVEAVKAACRPITDMRGSAAQRRHLAGVLTRRTIEGALRRAQGANA